MKVWISIIWEAVFLKNKSSENTESVKQSLYHGNMALSGLDTFTPRRNANLKENKTRWKHIRREKQTDGHKLCVSLLPNILHGFHNPQQASNCAASLSLFGINIEIRSGVKLNDGPNSWREGGAE